MKKNIFFLFFLFSLFSITAQEERSVELEQVTVYSKAKNDKIYSELGRIVTVLDKARIEESAARSIDELLDYVAGLDVRQRSDQGVQADLSIRGGTFDQVLVLLNGINITDPQTGHHNFNIPIDISNVDRVEVLQGSAARVLGPNAFSGAINIVTNTQKGDQMKALFTGGSFGTYTQHLSANRKKGDWSSLISVSHRGSKGYMKNTDYDLLDGFFQLTLDKSKYGLFNLQLAAQQKAFGAHSFYTPKYPDQYEKTRNTVASLSWSKTMHQLNIKAHAYWRQHHDRFELFRNMYNAAEWYKGHNYHRTDVTGAKMNVAYLAPWGRTTLGVDLRNEHIYSNVLGKEMTQPIPVAGVFGTNFTKSANRLFMNGFADYSVNFHKIYLSLGGALSHSSDFGLNAYGGGDVAYRFSEQSRIFASVNSAVRLPTYTDLYYKGPGVIGNEHLQPERSLSFEVGQSYQGDQFSINTGLFYRMGKNILDWVKKESADDWSSMNWSDVNAMGGELSAEYAPRLKWLRSINFSYAYTMVDRKSEQYISRYALDYLRNKMVVGVHHPLYQGLSLNWRFSIFDRAGEYQGSDNIKTSYKPYSLLDAQLRWNRERYEWFADFNNLLNVQYADFGGLKQPQFNFRLGVAIKL